jgi:hypothetical protein
MFRQPEHMSDASFRTTRLDNVNFTSPISRVINGMADHALHQRRILNRVRTKLGN